MKKRSAIFLGLICSAIILVSVSFRSTVYASSEIEKENKYYLGTLVNAGKDTGYSEDHEIDEDDPHFGWRLGEFYLSGYTRVLVDKDNRPVILKNVGDKVALWFILNQDIDSLNENEDLFVNEDTNGFDRDFGIERTDSGRGTLIIRHTDYQNKQKEPVIHTDYLSKEMTLNEEVQIELFEEGDYEVALNYEIAETKLDLLGWKPLPKYHNYRIFFQFSVRNGNTMVFPRDAITDEELMNTSVVENGFYLDFANSKYLKIDIKKEVLNEGADGLTEDVRFNRPAKDGEEYKDEGIYTITVTNSYTSQKTVKKIYVGTNSIMKAHLKTGDPIRKINQQIDEGAKIAEDGSVILSEVEPNDPVQNEDEIDDHYNIERKTLYLTGASLGAVLFIAAITLHRKRKVKQIAAERDGEGERQ